MARLWEHYPTIFLKHRAWGHPVEDLGSFVTHDDLGRRRIEQQFRCECQWWVYAYFTMTLVSTKQRAYVRPPGYSPTPSVADAREEWFIRFPPRTIDPEPTASEPARARA